MVAEIRQRQADFCEAEDNRVYIVISRPASATGRPCLNKMKKETDTSFDIIFLILNIFK